jgi:hypothetical protein
MPRLCRRISSTNLALITSTKMINNCFVSVGVCAIVGLIVSCASAGNATGPTLGSVRAFEANEAEVDSAITNAFASGRYRDMMLSEAAGHDYLAHGWHPTNGYLLQPGTGSLYQGYFHIVVTPVTTNQTKVIVRTIKAEAVDGKEPGLHGGWAFHFREIHPVPQEETNILVAIAAQLRASNVPSANRSNGPKTTGEK